jgi:hypothetical protein
VNAIRCLFLTLFAVPLAVGRAPGEVRIQMKADGTAVEVIGLDARDLAALAALQKPEQWTAVFAVYVRRGGTERAATAMLGSHRLVDRVLRFEPRFPLVRGVHYQAVFDPSKLPGGAGAAPVEKDLFLPRPQTPPTVVEHVYPSRDVLPENQLKFYLHFSAPMSRGEAYDHIRLLDAQGKPIELPFLELGEELWDRSGKRFTLFFDPGRIKRGLKPREEVGPALEEGKRYTLVIDQKWNDAEGQRLKATYRKAFRVAAPDDTQSEPKTWKLQAPSAGTKAPFVVVFPKPMDHALLQRLLWVIDQDGNRVPGTIAVNHEETHWEFTPTQPWQAGAYHLVADTRLEDLAGNSIARPFEVDLFRRVEREVKTETVKVAFSIAPAK